MSKAVLILGGTGEAASLADRLAGDSRLQVTTSLAGRTSNPRRITGRVRIGGFGGADGLCAYLEQERIGMLVDATHPFASRISAHAVDACERGGIDRLQLRRFPWDAQSGDRWIRVRCMEEAPRQMQESHKTVFLTTGHKGIELFSAFDDLRFVVRLVEAPKTPLPITHYTLILARGPFSEREEERLMQEHEIDLVVSKNSGGAATYAKISASAKLGIPVLMVDQPPPAPGPKVDSVEAAHGWVMARLNGARRPC
jgi:precorrin-6A/cobalt-precorrin-6A reductase